MYFLDSCTHFFIDKLRGHARPKECEEDEEKKTLNPQQKLKARLKQRHSSLVT